MWLEKLCQRWLAGSAVGRRSPTPRRRGLRLTLEPLEDRIVPSTFTAASVSDLIADIKAANAAGGANTITLVAGTTFNLTAVNNTTDGATGLPVIAANDNLSIVGNGAVIQRSTASGMPAFRLFDVASGASLALANLTLQGGLELPTVFVYANGGYAGGGAIFNQGSLSLNAVTVQNNSVMEGGSFGGGIDSAGGSLTLNACTIQNNQAVGGDATAPGQIGGAAEGGGIYVFGSSASLTNVILQNNSVSGGKGGPPEKFCNMYHKCHNYNPPGGNAAGGGMYVDGLNGGTVSLHNCIVTNNTANSPGGGECGGGLAFTPNAEVCLDAFTVANVTNNKPDNICGSYTICP